MFSVSTRWLGLALPAQPNPDPSGPVRRSSAPGFTVTLPRIWHCPPLEP
ncbi:MAG: hypothetical protein BWX88_05217 [Planctomycetes bacterium ADurb.Bin126]|nr:MAG: hypothetical protein BWX88_05217 [Planctomycetes bacterium ADurb.Bin126]